MQSEDWRKTFFFNLRRKRRLNKNTEKPRYWCAGWGFMSSNSFFCVFFYLLTYNLVVPSHRSYRLVKTHTSRIAFCPGRILSYLSPKACLQNSAASALVMRKLSPWNRPLGKMAFSSASMWLKIRDSLVRLRLRRERGTWFQYGSFGGNKAQRPVTMLHTLKQAFGLCMP